MAKFFIGVIVGIFLGASVSAYGAVAAGSGTLSGRTVAKDYVAVCFGPECDRYLRPQPGRSRSTTSQVFRIQ